MESGGKGLWTTARETADVPGGGARSAGELLFVGGGGLADHANAVSVAGQLANVRHWPITVLSDKTRREWETFERLLKGLGERASLLYGKEGERERRRVFESNEEVERI